MDHQPVSSALPWNEAAQGKSVAQLSLITLSITRFPPEHLSNRKHSAELVLSTMIPFSMPHLLKKEVIECATEDELNRSIEGWVKLYGSQAVGSVRTHFISMSGDQDATLFGKDDLKVVPISKEIRPDMSVGQYAREITGADNPA